MAPFPSITLQVRGRRLAGRLAFTILFAGVVLLGAAGGLIFVYSTDLPEIRALEDYRPNVVTELYSDDGADLCTLRYNGVFCSPGTDPARPERCHNVD